MHDNREKKIGKSYIILEQTPRDKRYSSTIG